MNKHLNVSAYALLRSALLVSVLPLSGCVGGDDETGTSTTTTAATEGMSSTSQATTSGGSSGGEASGISSSSDATSVSSGDSSDTDTDTGCGFIGCDSETAAPVEECRPPEQPCPEGMKCTLDGSPSMSHCVDVPTRPIGLGQPCTTEGWLSGLDDCDEGLICWTAGEGDVGACIEICYDDSCVCTDTSASIMWCQSCIFGLCIPGCDPLLDECGQGLVCAPNYGSGFECVVDGSGEAGGYGDPCEFVNACDPGLFCANGESVPDCGAIGCCTPFCDLNAPQCPGAEDGVVCVPYFDSDPPEAYTHVGACVIP